MTPKYMVHPLHILRYKKKKINGSLTFLQGVMKVGPHMVFMINTTLKLNTSQFVNIDLC